MLATILVTSLNAAPGQSETMKTSTAKDRQKSVEGGSITKIFEDPGPYFSELV